MADPTPPFFIVFDTSTHARYYGDVHEVLALPAGAIVRYEYKRSLCKTTAAAAIDRLVADPGQLPVPALLMYGQKRDFQQGQADPAEMLRWQDSVFVPTRSARIVAVAIVPGADAASDVLYLHFEMRGFIDPDLEAIPRLIQALEAEDALPFGDRARQHSWVSLLPAESAPDRESLASDDPKFWSKVVDKLIALPTQFANDVFWRVVRIAKADRRDDVQVPLTDRRSNARVHTNRWHRDYALSEGGRYEIFVQTHSPDAHGHQIPGNATVVLTSNDDDEGLIKLSARPLDIVPNETSSQHFSIATDNTIDARYSEIRLETQTPDHASAYPAGSMCTLTFAIRKQRWRLAAGSILVLAGTALAGYAAAATVAPLAKGAIATLTALLVAIGGWILTRQFKVLK